MGGTTVGLTFTGWALYDLQNNLKYEMKPILQIFKYLKPEDTSIVQINEFEAKKLLFGLIIFQLVILVQAIICHRFVMPMLQIATEDHYIQRETEIFQKTDKDYFKKTALGANKGNDLEKYQTNKKEMQAAEVLSTLGQDHMHTKKVLRTLLVIMILNGLVLLFILCTIY